jgi:hypothetical protein
MHDRLAGNMQMAFMCGVERAAQNADPANASGQPRNQGRT